MESFTVERKRARPDLAAASNGGVPALKRFKDHHEASDHDASDHEASDDGEAPDDGLPEHLLKKSRSRKKDLPEHHPPHGVRFDILWEDSELVYDGVARNLFHKLSRIASNFSLFPMDVPWNRQNKQSIHDAIGSIREEFNLSGSNEAYRHINERLNKFWRTAHNNLMSKYDNRDLTPDEVLKTLPDYIPKDQFARKLHDRRSKKGLVTSFINKKNRSKQMPHHFGSKSIGRRNYEAKLQGLSKDESWIRNLNTGYPKQESIGSCISWTESEEAKRMAETETMSKSALLEYRIQEKVGKSHKKTRVLGKGSTLSQNTPHRFNILDKGKTIIDEEEMQHRLEQREKEVEARMEKKMEEKMAEREARMNERMDAIMKAMQEQVQMRDARIFSSGASTSRAPLNHLTGNEEPLQSPPRKVNRSRPLTCIKRALTKSKKKN